ncbi:uncharacterized protein LOC135812201 [Sycon ciliatum]|uniref:uncharacterized protein LOC135812201 n=1 Tax=Sycon ciliatum TaxID=27933 RepID=UPI0020A9819C|eukprot:scpid16223/ scgid25877/ 
MSIVIPSQYLLSGVQQSCRQPSARSSAGCKLSEGSWHGTRVSIATFHAGEKRDTDAMIRKFLNEYWRIKELTHPNIIHTFGILQCSSQPDTLSLVMESTFSTLKMRYAREPMLRPIEQARIGLGIASAIEYLHDRCLMCCGLATGSVFVTGSGRDVSAKLSAWSEFGLFDCEPPPPLAYSPPEHRVDTTSGGKGKANNATSRDPASDTFALGVTLLAMCRQCEPLDQSARNLCHGDLALLGSDHSLFNTINKCLVANPEQRPTAAALCRELGTLLQSLVTQDIRRRATTRKALSNGRGESHESKAAATASVLQIRQGLIEERDRLLEELTGVQTRLEELPPPAYDQVVEEPQSEPVDSTLDDFAVVIGISAEANAWHFDDDEVSKENGDLASAESGNGVDETSCDSDSLTYQNISSLILERSAVLEAALAAAVAPPTSRRRQRHPPIDPDLIALSQTNSGEGMIARCNRVFREKQSELPQWVTIATYPEDALSCCSMPCTHDGCLYVAFLMDTDGAQLARAELLRLSLRAASTGSEDVEWTVITLPGDWHYRCYLFTAVHDSTERLYVAVIRRDLTGLYSIFSMAAPGEWRFVKQLPVEVFDFGLVVVGSLLLVMGGRQKPIWTSAASQGVYMTDLSLPNSPWLVLTSLPCACLSPRVVVTGHWLRCLGYNSEAQHNTCRVLSLDLSQDRAEQRWSVDIVAGSPMSFSAAVALNDHLITVGGRRGQKADQSTLADAFVYLEELREWLPFPPVQEARRGSHCLAWDKQLICISGMSESNEGSATGPVRSIECLRYGGRNEEHN